MNKKPLVSAFFSLFLSFMLLTFCLAIPVRAALSWNVQTVDDNAYTYGGSCPIALDSKGLPHIAYTDLRVETNRRQTALVMYADWNGTVWKTQQITLGFASSLVLDANDHPHILYETSPWDPLMYASWTGTKWNIQTVDPDFTSGTSGALALDSHGNPHIAYTDGTTIKYAVPNGTEWSIQTVATSKTGERTLSFVLDKNDTPCIMYSPTNYVYHTQPFDIVGINVSLATYQNSSWKITPLSLPTPTGYFGNLVVDSKGGLHSVFTRLYVNYENRIRGLVLYASWNGTDWDTQPVVSNIGFPYSMSLALDSRDYPHISCSNEPVYASWTGADWDVQATDVAGYLAVDADGNLHMSYLAGPAWIVTNLTYATATPPTPTPTSTPTHEPQQTNQTETLMGLAIIVAVLGAGLGLIIYLIKRK